MSPRPSHRLHAFVAGWILTATLAAHDPLPRADELWERLPEPLRRDGPPAPDAATVRELRALPGIGPVRALAIARQRFEHGLEGGPASWERVPGIGPETVRRLEAAFAARRNAPSASWSAVLEAPARGAYTPRGDAP